MDQEVTERLKWLGEAVGAEVTAHDARLLAAIPANQDFDIIMPDRVAEETATYVITTLPGADNWSMKGIVWRGWNERPYMVGFSAGRPKAQAAQGEGAKLFYRQVSACVRYNIPKILTTGAGQYGSWMVGYYAWPRLGYDGRIGDGPWRKMPPELREVCGEDRSVLRLCQHQFGRTWWRENGKTIDLVFDARPGSHSMLALEAYVKEKGFGQV